MTKNRRHDEAHGPRGTPTLDSMHAARAAIAAELAVAREAIEDQRRKARELARAAGGARLESAPGREAAARSRFTQHMGLAAAALRRATDAEGLAGLMELALAEADEAIAITEARTALHDAGDSAGDDA